MKSDIISIITIIYNDSKHILDTMDSVINQTHEYIEYIIIDGESTDGSKTLIQTKIQTLSKITKIEMLENKFYIEAQHKNKQNFYFKFLSQKDQGIYDAMNKGVHLASGKWCNFMNCGDKFYAQDTIQNLLTAYNSKSCKADIIYGNTQIIYDPVHTKILKCKTTNHKYHHHFIHQSAFINTDLLKKYKYDTSFKIAGDTDFFTKAYNTKVGFAYFDIVICSFNVTGISSKLSWRMFQEDCRIGFKYNKLFPIFHTCKYIFWIIPRVCIRNIIPAAFRNKARVLLSKSHS